MKAVWVRKAVFRNTNFELTPQEATYPTDSCLAPFSVASSKNSDIDSASEHAIVGKLGATKPNSCLAIHVPNPLSKYIGVVIKRAAECGERGLGRLSHIDDLQLGELLESLFSKLIAETRLLRATEWNRRI